MRESSVDQKHADPQEHGFWAQSYGDSLLVLYIESQTGPAFRPPAHPSF